MGWSIGFDDNWKRDIGYGVPAYCDHPGCLKEIDRGLGYVCGGEPYGGEYGCGLFFCGEHTFLSARRPQRCARCKSNRKPFSATPDHPDWIRHKLTDESWAQWRAENPDEVMAMPIEAINKRLTVQTKGEIPREVEALKSKGFIVGTWCALDHQHPDGAWVIGYTELRKK